VEASLAGLRRGELICIPGVGNQLLSAVGRIAPRAWTRRIAAQLTRRALA
jgi:hypothetical protein